MALLLRNDEQIKVGTTPGLVAGTSYFRFDGSETALGSGIFVPDYRGYLIVISELTGRGILVEGLDFSWNYITGEFEFLQASDIFSLNTWYNVHFENPVPAIVPVTPTNLIDQTWFIRNINIPNIDANKPSNAVELDRILSFIQKYEPECLKKILGFPMYNLLLTETSQRMTDLILGADYTNYYGHNRHWDGLIQPIPKISLIANYIYFYYQEANTTHTSGVNTNIPKGEASTAVSPGDKMINAWEFFASETKNMLSFLGNKNNESPAVYPEFTEWQYWRTRALAQTIYSPF